MTELKWEKDQSQIDNMETYVKQNLSKKDIKSIILGFSWNKQGYYLETKFLQRHTEATERGVLQYLVSVYDPIELMSPALLHGKRMLREIWNLKIG